MAYSRNLDAYRQSAVGGASPVALVVMLYDGALRFMEAGRVAMEGGDLPAQNAALQRAQKIVLELMGALDMRKGGEVASNLMALYSYVLNELVAANLEDRAGGIANAMSTMAELRQGWAELDRQTRAAPSIAAPSGATSFRQAA